MKLTVLLLGVILCVLGLIGVIFYGANALVLTVIGLSCTSIGQLLND